MFGRMEIALRRDTSVMRDWRLLPEVSRARALAREYCPIARSLASLRECAWEIKVQIFVKTSARCYWLEVTVRMLIIIGYYQLREQLFLAVLSPNDCNCAQLRCRDTHAFIAVNGQIAGKVIFVIIFLLLVETIGGKVYFSKYYGIAATKTSNSLL